MPRRATLRKKNGYWYTKAGNPSGQYFGRIEDVPYSQAQQRFADYLKHVSLTRGLANQSQVTVLALCEAFLDWVKANRSERTYDERQRHLERFCRFHVGSQLIAELPATEMQATDLQSFLCHIKSETGMHDFTADKHATSIKAAFNWASKHPSPTPLLPGGFRPFASIEKYKRPNKPLLEDELPTKQEILDLLAHADDDLASICKNGKKCKREPSERRTGTANPYRGFSDMLRCYWHTGARTSELAKCRVKDFVRTSRQIVIGFHKRSKTMRDPVPRRIALNDEAYSIIDRLCKGKERDDFIFLDPNSRPWTRQNLATRFQSVRERAGVRDEITIYSFRHLWISEMLMSGVDIATVAKMAGTSVAMIEKVYGHFSSDHFQKAQAKLDKSRRLRASA